MKRSVCGFLAALMLLLWTVPAASAASPASITYRAGSGGMALEVSGISGGVYAAQLSLEVSGSLNSAVFTPARSDVYSPGCQVQKNGDSTTVTIYLVSEDSPMNSGSSLSLGTLDLGGAALPATGELTLLNYGLQVASVSGTVPLRPASNPSPGGRPSGGSSDRDDRDEQSKPAEKPPEKPDYSGTVLPFLDVRGSEWYYSAVQYVYARGMMSGTSADGFSPGLPTTRGMIVTILHRLEGSPAAVTAVFPDVDQSLYYAVPIAWANEQGLVNGYDNGRFGPDDPITRQQLAAILYRYAIYKSYRTSPRGSLEGFRDAGTVSAYAVEPISWAVGTGLISGMDNGAINPAGQATRAQVATILMRFGENVAAE